MATVSSVLTASVISGRFQARWEARRKLSGLVSTEFSDQLDKGAIVKVPLLSPVPIYAYDDNVGFANEGGDRVSVTSFNVTADVMNLTRPVITAIEIWLTSPALQDATLNSAADAHLKAYEASILTKLLTGTALAGGTQDVSTPALAGALTGALRVAAANEEWPDDGNWYIIGSPAFCQLLIDAKLVTLRGDNAALVDGHLGGINGFQLVEYTGVSDKVIAFHGSAIAGTLAFSASQIVPAPTVVGEEFRGLTVHGVNLVQREYDVSTVTTKGVIVATVDFEAES